MPDDPDKRAIPPLAWDAKTQPMPRQLTERYGPNTSQACVDTMQRFLRDEPRMTAEFVSAIPEGARPHGLEYRLKSPESLARKIADKSKDGSRTAQHAAASLNDVARYTVVARTPAEVLPTAYQTVAELEAKGWRMVEAEHSYRNGHPYKGLHTVMEHPSGNGVEIQYHSEASQACKDQNHKLYETMRDSNVSLAERQECFDRMQSAWSTVPAPPGLDDPGRTLGGKPIVPKTYERPGTPPGPGRGGGKPTGVQAEAAAAQSTGQQAGRVVNLGAQQNRKNGQRHQRTTKGGIGR